MRKSKHSGARCEQAFWAKVDRKSEDECWEWLAGQNGHGYGKFWNGSQIVQAHRYSWILSFGPIPEGRLVLHKCNNRTCVNPRHLYVGDQGDNMGDMLKSNRQVKEHLTYRKLYDEDIAEIRRLLAQGIIQRIIAEMFKVHQRTISSVKNNPNFPTRGSVWNRA